MDDRENYPLPFRGEARDLTACRLVAAERGATVKCACELAPLQLRLIAKAIRLRILSPEGEGV